MLDIGIALNNIMHEEQCSPLGALFILSETGEDYGLHFLQSESAEKTSRRLCDSCNFQINR